jgi:hypothetical protein
MILSKVFYNLLKIFSLAIFILEVLGPNFNVNKTMSQGVLGSFVIFASHILFISQMRIIMQWRL